MSRMIQDPAGINFVSRAADNNGVCARVKLIPGITPIPAGMISVPAGGSVLEAYLQPEPFYSGRDLLYLRPLQIMTDQEKLFYASCIRLNKTKYSYGRQANKTLGSLMVPAREEIPSWVNATVVPDLQHFRAPLEREVPDINAKAWIDFLLVSIFDLKKGKRLTKRSMKAGSIPFIGATDSGNGITAWIGQAAMHPANTITVSYNGSVGEAFYQAEPYWATDDVNVLYPRFELNIYRALFIITSIRFERHRFNYARKWNLDRMKKTTIRLPAGKDRNPDWEYMERYIKGLPYSSVLKIA
jgi:hypothetical protein